MHGRAHGTSPKIDITWLRLRGVSGDDSSLFRDLM
jgi:hypothetical protein